MNEQFRKSMVKHAFLPLLFFVALFVVSCSSTPKEKASSLEELFSQGVQQYENKKYTKARKSFQTLKDNYPLSKYSTLAELRIADSYYYNGKYIEAIFFYEEFKKLHPTNEVIPYVLYQIGMAYYKEVLSIDKDQAFTEKARTQFEYLISRYPASSYASLAKKKLRLCEDKLARHEFYVGHLYLKRKKHTAALYRFKRLVDKYPQSIIADKGYFYVGKSYLSLKENEKAKEALLLLTQNYPQSKYIKKAQSLLSKLK